MIDCLEPYPAYKDTGVPWLAQVPEHWEVPRLGTLLRERGETNDDNGVTEVLSVMRDRGVIPYAEKGNIGNKKSEDITRYKIVRPDDIVVNCMNVIIGSVGLSKYTGCLSPVYYVLTRRSETDTPHYLNAYFQTKPFQESLVRIGNGILAHRMRIPMELLKSEPFPRPPTAEQSAIVRFLNYADLRIQRYIRAKQKVLKLLEEQKQIIVHRAVTRGLDPDVSLKPSGVEWIGDVPEHWEVKPLKHLVPHVTVGIVVQPARLYVERGVPCLRSLNISGGFLNPENLVFISQESNLEQSKSQIFGGDLVVVRTGQAGVAVIVPPEFDGANCIDLLIVRRSAMLLSEYLVIYLNSWPARTDVQYRSVGAIQAHYNTGTLANMVIPVPPISEQRKLIDEITKRIDPIIRLAEITRREIELVRGYRTRLIADVVTGKLDVREAAAKLPDEALETEPLDETEDMLQDETVAEDIDIEAADAA